MPKNQLTPTHRKLRAEVREKIPTLFSIPAGIVFLFIAVAILGLLWRVPWSSLNDYIGSSTTLTALRISAIVSFSAACLSVILGMPLAYVMSKTSGMLKTGLRITVLLPLVLPPVVGGTALLFTLGRRGIIGEWLDKWFGITLPFSTVGAILAATFVALPFFIISAETALTQADPKLEEAAKVLGAGSLARFFQVLLPQIRQGILAGAALSWARAIGEFGATITFAGNLGGRTQTLPLAMYEALESGRLDEALGISLLLLLISIAILVILRGHWFPAFRSDT